MITAILIIITLCGKFPKLENFVTTEMFIMELFVLKHLVFDWLYQPPFMYKNKGL